MQGNRQHFQYVYHFEEDNLTVKIGPAVTQKHLFQYLDFPKFHLHNPIPLFPPCQLPFMNYFRTNQIAFNTCKSINIDDTLVKIEQDYQPKKPQQKSKDPKLMTALDISNIDLLCQITQCVQCQQQKIREFRSKFQQTRNALQTSLFEMYVNKLKGMKKTKQEKLKFLIRRSLKYFSARKSLKNKVRSGQPGISQGARKQQIFLSLDNIGKRLTSKFSQKTLITALKESSEYRKIFIESLESAEEQFRQNNRKKVNEVAKIIQKCLQSKNVNHLKARLKMPWTKVVFDNIIQYGHQLLSYSE